MQHYILKGRLVVPATLEQWAEFFPSRERVIGVTSIGDVDISTVFLGIDHRIPIEPDQPPVVFETMVFPDRVWEYCTRCSTYEQALVQHQRACRHVRMIQRQLPVITAR